MGGSPRFLLSADLFKEPECPPNCDPHEGHHWKSHPCQPGATGSPPMGTLEKSAHDPQKAKGWILDELDLQRLKDWPEKEWKQARELLIKWEHLFAHSSLDLRKTSSIKHHIKLTDRTPFKECHH